MASRFVLENPTQVKKALKTHKTVTKPAVSILRADDRQQFNDFKRDERLVTVLRRIAEIADSGASVYLMARFGFTLPNRAQLQQLKSEVPTLKLETYRQRISSRAR
jgi:DNA helicase-4